jgi:uncharacterized membrane protein
MIRPSNSTCLIARFAGDARGVVSIMAALLIVLGLGLSVLVADAGHLYLAKRRLQSAVDAAALSAAGDPTQAAALASASLTRNGFTTSATVETGTYTADPALAGSARFVAGAAAMNAVRVTKTMDTPTYFAGIFGLGLGSSVKATATATRLPGVAFAAGTGLATVSNGQINQLLGGLFGTTLNLSLVNYQALASTNVDALSFLNQLAAKVGVTAGTYGDLANANVTVGQVIAAAQAAVNIQGGANAASLDALNLLSLQLPQSASMALSQVIDTTLWTKRPIGSIVQQTPGQVTLNLFDVLAAQARVYGPGHLATLNTGLALPITGTGVTARLTVGSPMTSVGISPVGTSLSTAQVRLALITTAANINLGLVSANISLPVYLQIASGTATASAIPCDINGTRATIAAAAQAAAVQIGTVTDAGMKNFAANPTVTAAPVATITLLGIPIALNAGASLTVAGGAPTPLNFTQSQINAGTSQTASGSASGQIFSQLANSLTLTTAFNGGALTTTINGLLNGTVLPLLKPLLVSILGALDPVTDTLLRTLGLRLGAIDVVVRGVACGVPTLVH